MELVEVEDQSQETSLDTKAFEIGKSEIRCHPPTFKPLPLFSATKIY